MKAFSNRCQDLSKGQVVKIARDCKTLYFLQQYAASICSSNQSRGAPPGPDFQVVALRACLTLSFTPFGGLQPCNPRNGAIIGQCVRQIQKNHREIQKQSQRNPKNPKFLDFFKNQLFDTSGFMVALFVLAIGKGTLRVTEKEKNKKKDWGWSILVVGSYAAIICSNTMHIKEGQIHAHPSCNKISLHQVQQGFTF